MSHDIKVTLTTDKAEAEMRRRLSDIEAYSERLASKPLPDLRAIRRMLLEAFPGSEAILSKPPARWFFDLYPLKNAFTPFSPESDRAYDALRALTDYESIKDAKEKPSRIDPTSYLEAILESAQRNAGGILQALERIDKAQAWKGSPVTVKAMIASQDADMERWQDITGFEVEVGKSLSKWEPAPSFTYFVLEDPEEDPIGDVLEGGDEDFFRSPSEQADYFTLINEIRKPGSAAKKGRILTLYTARPSSDRSRFQNADTVPANIFLSSSEMDASGIALDFGKRDLWLIRLNSKELVMTMDADGVKHYQVANPEGAALAEYPILVQTWEELRRSP